MNIFTNLSQEQLVFYVKGCRQLIRRFPLKNKQQLQQFNFLDPLEVKSGSIASISDVAILFPNIIDESNLQLLDNEWRLLRNTKEIVTFPDDVF